ncbi:glycosyltransferase [Amnibacterium soli]|uniref:Glycosyltransferase n=1 Tax=Amnibacterium soli TaxID=1282736 RepID=A0ABP8Z997_9MICO
MARVLFTSARQDGFVLPLLQLVRAMAARGDEVWFLCGEAHRERIEEAGATFLRLPYDAEVPPGRVPRRRGRRRRSHEVPDLLWTLFLGTVEADFHAVMALHHRIGFDLLIAEPTFVGATAVGLLPRYERPAVLTLGILPLPFSSPDVAPFGAGRVPLEGPLNPLRNALLQVAANATRTGALRQAFGETIERLTGHRPTGQLFDLGLTADVWAQASVPQFEYPRRSTPDRVRYVGPLPAPAGFPLPDWWYHRDGRRIVHVTQGTYANQDPTELIVPTIAALADEDVLVVATTGGPDPASVERALGGALPANARVERFLPYDHLLPAAHVMVTNGGFGAVHHALRHGLPLVVAGTTEDRLEVNARVRWTGVGVDLQQQRADPARVRTAVRQVLDERARFRRAASRLASAIAATDAVASVLDIADELTSAPAGRPARR